MRWDPTTYLKHAGERGRPFFDLTARIDATDPELVVDLGCGPGNLTATLAERWPGAQIIGVDNSADMLDRARSEHGDGIDWQLADLRDWQPPGPVDVIVSNAALQWVENYGDHLPRLIDALAPNGWLALQVPVNHDEPLHRLLRKVAAEPEFAPSLAGIERYKMLTPNEVGDILLDTGSRVDVWQTTYWHLLTGPDPVFGWIAGTGARPTLQALEGELKDKFVARYQELLRAAYPETAHGTWLPFPRLFAVAQRS